MARVLRTELFDDRSELGDRREARDQRLLFVGLVTSYLTREELRHVARRRLVETQVAKALFEPPVRSRQLLEGVVHEGMERSPAAGRQRVPARAGL